MDREPEKRRDLEPAQPAPNPLGGELFTVITKHYGTSTYNGTRIVVQRTEDRHQPFLPVRD